MIANRTYKQIENKKEDRFSYFFKDHIIECYNSKFLKHLYSTNMVFRIKGDDFIVISKKDINIYSELSKNLIDKKGIISFEIKQLSIDKYDTIKKLKDLVRAI